MPSGLVFSTSGLTMKSIRANPTAHIIALFALAIAWVSPAFAADIPDDHAQDVLIRSTLSTFNDANMTNDYTVFFAKSAKELQALAGPEKMSAAFEVFRRNRGYFENVVTAEYESSEKPVIDKDGGLNLAGVFKVDEMDVKYNLRFFQNDNVWKVVSINVNINRPKKL
jgi:hypothetical protein